jgi:hypothetical protein
MLERRLFGAVQRYWLAQERPHDRGRRSIFESMCG